MCHTPRWVTIIWQFPEFFDAQTVNLWLASLVEIKTLRELLSQRAARAFAEHCHFRAQVNTRLVIWFGLPFLINSLVARANTDDAVIFIIKHLRSGKFGEDVDASLFAFFAEPSGQTIERDDVIAVILEWRWCDGRANCVRLRQVEKIVFLDERFERRALFDEIRYQLLERARVHHRA